MKKEKGVIKVLRKLIEKKTWFFLLLLLHVCMSQHVKFDKCPKIIKQ